MITYQDGYQWFQIYTLLSQLDYNLKQSAFFLSNVNKRPRTSLTSLIGCQLSCVHLWANHQQECSEWQVLLPMCMVETGVWTTWAAGEARFHLRGKMECSQTEKTAFCYHGLTPACQRSTRWHCLPPDSVTPHSSWIHGSQKQTKAVVSEFLARRSQLVWEVLLPLINTLGHWSGAPHPSCPQKRRGEELQGRALVGCGDRCHMSLAGALRLHLQSFRIMKERQNHNVTI